MGSGKTSWSIQHINESPFENVLYITPFLNEVERIIENTNRDFKQPSYKGGTKLQKIDRNFATLRALFHKNFPYLQHTKTKYSKNKFVCDTHLPSFWPSAWALLRLGPTATEA